SSRSNSASSGASSITRRRNGRVFIRYLRGAPPPTAKQPIQSGGNSTFARINKLIKQSMIDKNAFDPGLHAPSQGWVPVLHDAVHKTPLDRLAARAQPRFRDFVPRSQTRGHESGSRPQGPGQPRRFAVA